MPSPFAVRPLARPSFLRRLFTLPDPENGYIELENLLASTRWADLHDGHIEQVLRNHGVTSMNRDRAKELYGRALASFVSDDHLSAVEIDALQRLAGLLGIRSLDVAELEREIVHPRYQQRISDVLRDERVTDAERTQLATLRKALRIDDRTAIEIWQRTAEPILTRHVQQAMGDRRLTATEKQALDALARSFGIQVQLDAATKAQLDRFHWYWLMEHGTFPQIPANIHLQPGEVCHFAAAAEMHEMRTETQLTSSAGASVRIKIMKGVYYRLGSTTRHRITRDVLRKADDGTLYVTNKRILFDGARKNAAIRLSGILSVVPYSDAVEIEKTSGRNPIFTVADTEWLTVLLTSRLAHA